MYFSNRKEEWTHISWHLLTNSVVNCWESYILSYRGSFRLLYVAEDAMQHCSLLYAAICWLSVFRRVKVATECSRVVRGPCTDRRHAVVGGRSLGGIHTRWPLNAELDVEYSHVPTDQASLSPAAARNVWILLSTVCPCTSNSSANVNVVFLVSYKICPFKVQTIQIRPTSKFQCMRRRPMFILYRNAGTANS